MDKNKIITLDGLKDYDTLIKEWCPVKPDSNAVDGIINGNLVVDNKINASNLIVGSDLVVGNGSITLGSSSSSIKVNANIDASGKTITATTFKGKATSAEKATQDASGNVITSTYATKSSLRDGTQSIKVSDIKINVLDGNNGHLYKDTDEEGRLSIDKIMVYGKGIYFDDTKWIWGNGTYMSIGYNGSLSNNGISFQSSGGTLNGTWKLSSGQSVTSDARLKNSIENCDIRYDMLFNNLILKRFKYNDGTSDRYHLGFIAQDLQASIKSAGLSEQEVAALCTFEQGKENEHMGIRYEEIIPLNTDQIQKLKARVSELEAQNILLNARIEALESKLLAHNLD